MHNYVAISNLISAKINQPAWVSRLIFAIVAALKVGVNLYISARGSGGMPPGKL